MKKVALLLILMLGNVNFLFAASVVTLSVGIDDITGTMPITT